MARARRRHIQGELLDASGMRPKSARGGKRRGAGRPPKGSRSSESHKKREAFKASEPVHVVLRVEREIGSLRRRKVFRAVRAATFAVARREEFRIVHLSIQRTHLHLLVEAKNRTELARGMQAFQISAARHMNRVAERRGRVFTDRYHAEVIRSRRQARHALAYVLNNWRKHREDVGRSWNVDPFSSGWSFCGWRSFEGRQLMWPLPEGYYPLIVWLPKTWLLGEGWMLYGRIDFREVPSAPKAPAGGSNRRASRTAVSTSGTTVLAER